MRRLHAGTVAFDSPEAVRSFVLDLTGNEDQAEAAVYRWRERRAERGEEIR